MIRIFAAMCQGSRLISSGECGIIKAVGVRLPARLCGCWVSGLWNLALAYNAEHGSGSPCSIYSLRAALARLCPEGFLSLSRLVLVQAPQFGA